MRCKVVIYVLDLDYGVLRTTAAFVVETGKGLVLIETGPDSTYNVLVECLAALGYAPEDVQNVLVTYIHLDHAGAAWRFAEQGAKVHVHPRGAKPLQNPSRLLDSAERIFGEQTEDLWRRPMPVATERIRAVDDREVLRPGGVEIEALETPGHTDHHLTWKIEDAIFTGDVGGVRI